jgi:hypothetical protein
MNTIREKLRLARRWLIWFGGWERASTGTWDFKSGPTPVSLFGHRVTFYGGWWMQFKARAGAVVLFAPWARHRSSSGALAFWSPNGTPGHADATLLVGNRSRWERDR